MKQSLLFDFQVDKNTSSVLVKREFAAARSTVWDAFTKADILDRWWAPKPWQSKTKSMDFNVNGRRLYAMCGPDGEEHWALAEFTAINNTESFEFVDAFCDENGKINNEFPRSNWRVQFSEENGKTLVSIEIKHKNLQELEAMIKLGFKEGFTMALEHLDDYIEAQFKLRNEAQTTRLPRVCTYLNFDGKTEEAFLFYKSVFKSEFSGKGVQRLGDIPASADQPPVADSVKKMILHVELPILGNHVLMGTDAPKEMGFSLTQGDNVHISLQPSSRQECTDLFHALSKNGTVTMELNDMFLGSYFTAYYGSCTDQFGINWMFYFQNEETSK
jgi:PhnB protein